MASSWEKIDWEPFNSIRTTGAISTVKRIQWISQEVGSGFQKMRSRERSVRNVMEQKMKSLRIFITWKEGLGNKKP
jgi:hypothetical protein